MNATPQQNWNEQDLLTDILTQEKYLMNAYTDCIKESSCANLRGILMGNLGSITQDQFQVFEEMNKKGFYPVKDASSSEVQTVRQNVSGLAQTLPV